MASSTILSATFFGSTRYFPLSTFFFIPATLFARPAFFPRDIISL